MEESSKLWLDLLFIFLLILLTGQAADSLEQTEQLSQQSLMQSNVTLINNH